MSMIYRAVVFDLDGTLIDSAPSLRNCAAQMLAERGLPEPDVETVTGFIGNGVPKLVERCLRWAGAPEDALPDALARFTAIYDADPLAGTVVYPGARELLSDLEAAGVPMGLCTNKPEAPARAVLAGLELGPFASVVGGDSLPVRKPDPAPLLRVIEEIGVARDQVLYVGDTGVDWATARNANVPYAHLTDGYQRKPIDDLAPALTVAGIGDLGAAMGLSTDR